MNESLLSLFHTELLIDRHFEALRRFMLMQDGEFGHSLSHQLFDKVQDISVNNNNLESEFHNLY